MTKETKYEIYLMGEFHITDGINSISERSIRSKKLLLLLAYLVEMHDRRIPSQELIDLIWMDGEVAHPAEALKNLVYRLRTELAKTWPGVSFIRSEKGYYFWEPGLPIRVDSEELDRLMVRGRAESDPKKQIEIYRKLVNMPAGEFLSGARDVFWVSNRDTYLRNQYQEAVNRYCSLLTVEGDYEEIKRVCLRVLDYDPVMEAMHVFLMKAYIAENRRDLAEEHYRRTKEVYYRMLGEDVTASIRDIYEELMKRENAEDNDLRAIQTRLLKEQQARGAYYCDYGLFVKLYDLQARRFVRDALPVTLALITLVSEHEESEEMQEEMDSLRDAIRRTLRGGDVVTRYSNSQYLIMLPGCETHNGEGVIGRIRRSFYRNRKRRQCELHYKFLEMSVEKTHEN